MHQLSAMRLFSIILLITFSSPNSFSQPISMLGPNVTWHEMGVAFTDNTMQFFPHTEWTDGDTLINNILYYKFYSGNESQTSIFRSGYIREDSGKVYVRMSETATNNWCENSNAFPLNEDLLLFDTSTEVGDTIEVWTFFDVPDTLNRLEILTIDTQFIAGMDRRVFYFISLDTPWNFDNGWIDGIGSLGGLFSPWCPISEGWVELGCYHNDTIIYPILFNCGGLSIKEIDHSLEVSIVPNPSNSYISIQKENDSKGRYDITIYDLKGSIFIRQESISIESKIDISELSFGMYFIHIQFEDGRRAVKKFIKN